VSSHAQLENQELRAEVANLRRKLKGAGVPSQDLSHDLLQRHHLHAKHMLIEKDAQMRLAEAEIAELQGHLTQMSGQPNMLEDRSASQSEFGVPEVATRPSTAGNGRASTAGSSRSRSGSTGRRPTTPPVASEEDLMEQMRLPGQIYAAESFLPQEVDSSDEEITVPERTRGSRIKPKKGGVLDLRERMESLFANGSYSITQYYHETGIFQLIARHPMFENIAMLAIILNVIYIGCDTAFNTADALSEAEPVFIVFENLFCGFFLVEIIVRFGAIAEKWRAFRDMNFCFDLSLVTLMIAETWILFGIMLATSSQIDFFDPSTLRLLRLLKISKVARIVRVLRTMPEIMILLKAVGVASRSVFFTMMLLGSVIYVFAIAFTHMTKDTHVGSMYFASLSHSSFTLLYAGCFGDGLREIADELYDESYLLGSALLLFLLFAPLTVLNLLVGVLVEVVGVVAATENESMDVQFVTDTIRGVMNSSSLERDAVSIEDFKAILDNKVALRAFQEVGVDVVAMAEYPDIIFGNDEEISFKEFMEEVLLLRGSNAATLKDVIFSRKTLMNDIAVVLGNQLQVINKNVKKKSKH